MIDGAQYRKLEKRNKQFDPENTTSFLTNKIGPKGSLAMGGYLKLIGVPSYRNVLNCNDLVVIGIDRNENTEIRHTSQCHHPLCPNCQKVKFKSNSLRTSQILSRLVKQTPHGFFKHFTFSSDNVTNGKALHNSLVRLSQAVNIFFNYKEVSKHLVGFVNTLEDKTSWSRGNMQYNPHTHVVAYFDQDVSLDVKKYWSRAAKRCNLNEKSYFHSEPIKATKGHSALDNAETVVKYDDKPYNLLDGKLTGIKSKKNLIKAIRDHVMALYRLQKVKYGGQCKIINKTIQQVNKAKKILRTKYQKPKDVIQMTINYNSKKRAYFFNGMIVENNYLANSKLSLKEIHRYKDTHLYLE